MMFYSSAARKSAIESIHDLNKKIATIPGNYLDYNDARKLHNLLGIFENEINKEQKKFGYSKEV